MLPAVWKTYREKASTHPEYVQFSSITLHCLRIADARNSAAEKLTQPLGLSADTTTNEEDILW